MAGYALARIPFRGKGIFFAIILLTLMVPSAVTFVPTYVVVAKLGGVNTLWGIVVPGLFSAFATFLFRQFYLEFPSEIEEAARLDGNSYFGVYWRMVLPNSLGIMAALGVLSFIGSWNAFLWPVIIGQSNSSQTVQVVLSSFLTAQTINLPALFAGAAVGAAPLVVVFLLLQRYIAQGVRMAGIKG
jgi:multiple sugar transport system permease protein